MSILNSLDIILSLLHQILPSLEGYGNRASCFGFRFHYGSIFTHCIIPNSIIIVAFPSIVYRPNRQIILC